MMEGGVATNPADNIIMVREMRLAPLAAVDAVAVEVGVVSEAHGCGGIAGRWQVLLVVVFGGGGGGLVCRGCVCWCWRVVCIRRQLLFGEGGVGRGLSGPHQRAIDRYQSRGVTNNAQSNNGASSLSDRPCIVGVGASLGRSPGVLFLLQTDRCSWVCGPEFLSHERKGRGVARGKSRALKLLRPMNGWCGAGWSRPGRLETPERGSRAELRVGGPPVGEVSRQQRC